jgi:hypothetical protein
VYNKTKDFNPPTSNTGVAIDLKEFQPVELGIDWLAGSFPTTAIGQVCKLIESVFEEKFPEDFFGSRWYAKVYQISKGVRLSTDARADGKTKSYISVSASALSSLTSEQQYNLMSELYHLDFVCSRVDIKLDDYSKTLTPALAYQAIEEGNYTGFQQKVYRRWLESGTLGVKSQTLEVGRRGSSGSGKFVRIYTKWVQTMFDENPVDSNRLEIEFSEKKSSQVFEFLLSVGVDSWTDLMLNLITGAIDFIDRVESTEDGKRFKAPAVCERLSWWQQVIGDVIKIKLSAPRKVVTIAKAFNWIRKQVAPTFAMLCDYLYKVSKDDIPDLDVKAFWFELWSNGSDRYSDNHRALLAQI